MALKITAENFESVVLNSEKPVLVDFWATWCGPCKMIAPVVEQLSEEYAEKLVVGKVDVDEAPTIAARYNVMSIPTLILFENGKEAKRLVGFMPKAKLISELGL